MENSETPMHEWNRIIEYIFECPVCLTFTKSSYIICQRGHHVCSYCIKEIQKCPMCYNLCMARPIKHLAADNLISKLVEIQESIDEDIKSATTKSQQDCSVQTDLFINKLSVSTQTNEINRLIVKSSVNTQTENVPTTNVYNNNNIVKKKQITTGPHCHQCLIGCCNFTSSFEEMKTHLRRRHKSTLEEHYLLEHYQKSIVVPRHNLPWDYEFVIIFHHTAQIGFVNFFIRSSGCFKCCVRYAEDYPSLSTTLKYTITILTESKLKFTGEVKPSSIQMRGMYDQCFSEKAMSAILQMDFIAFTFEWS